VKPKQLLNSFRCCLSERVALVKQASVHPAGLREMLTDVADELAPKFEQGVSKYSRAGVIATASD
jgi:hypothetical protein